MNQPDHLIEAMQQGNEKAFSSIYQMYSGAINGVIYTILKDRNLTEEVLQDVFVKVWNNSQSYTIGKGRFYTWLLNIARNAAIDKTRSKDFKNSGKNLTTDNFVDILAGHDNLSRRMDALGIKKFVEALKPICVKIIDLLYFKGFTQAEAAEELDSPLGTIKTRARNCIGELRTAILEEKI
ncbi:MAG: sigma-70 family RNA polymerase sigma factor [Flavobacteriaceae bacterium]|nr:sigma-70 family RNA polymerase sigma factor [Flavobacteriaceae bacterium]